MLISVIVKPKLVLLQLYCTQKAYIALCVQYNNTFWMLEVLRYSSASGMFRTDGFYVIMQENGVAATARGRHQQPLGHSGEF